MIEFVCLEALSSDHTEWISEGTPSKFSLIFELSGYLHVCFHAICVKLGIQFQMKT